MTIPTESTELRGLIKDVLHDELSSVLKDVSWRIGQQYELAARNGQRPHGSVYAEDLDLPGRAILTGYTVTNSSPSAGSIAWVDLHIVYSGVDHVVTNGNTALKYAWWKASAPTTLQTSATKPSLTQGDCLIFINNAGIATVALSDTSTSMPTVVADNAVDAGAIQQGAVTTTAVNFTARDLGATTTFYGSTQPTGAKVGDLWLDTSNTLHRYEGSTWVIRQDADIQTGIQNALAASTAAGNAASAASTALQKANAAQNAADAAQSTADGAISTYYQTTKPWADSTVQPASKTGDMWYDETDNVAYRWSGPSAATANKWMPIEDTDIALALGKANTAQTTADGKITAYYLTTAPTIVTYPKLDTGDLWYNTTGQATGKGNVVSYWNGAAWVAVPLGTDGIANGAIIQTKIGPLAVGSGQLGNGSVTSGKVGSGAVGPANLNVLQHFLY